ncbi:MAG: cytochrome P450, partial [Ilumatobacteraceae bacterium]
MTSYSTPESIYGPVSDWATDFDHGDPEYNRHAHAIWTELRGTCPVAHSDRYGGTWLPVTHEHVREIAYDTENFTSRAVVVSTVVPEDPAPIGGAPPITSDPPFHHEARRLVLPPFSPKKIAEWEPEIRRLCN